jgi:flavin reductase (DIM6/NTAB) family NADH-FMN oxidoreductase RutF
MSAARQERSMKDFDTVVAQLDTSMVIVTTAAGDQRAGCLVGFHTQCSIDPPRYAVWLSKANLTYRVALFATHVAVHGVDAANGDIARLFGGERGDETDKFTRCDWTAGPGGVPLLDDCPNRFVLERLSLWDDGSDHTCLVGAPVEARWAGEFDALRLAAARTIEPGHDVHDRVAPPDLHRRPTR